MEVPMTPLARATEGEHHAVIEILQMFMDIEAVIAFGEPDDLDQRQLFLVSAACGWADLTEKLLEQGCSADFATSWIIKMKRPELECICRKYRRKDIKIDP